MKPFQTVHRRLLGIDAARGLALLGIMAVHIVPQVGTDGQVPVWQLLASNRSTALFPILAGVGLALATQGSTPIKKADLSLFRAGLITRALIIFVIGLILGLLDSGVAVILAHFGLLFILAIPFLRLRFRTLIALAAGWAVLAPVISHAIRIEIPMSSYGNPTVDSFEQPLNLLSELTLTGYYPVFPWMAYLFLGLAIGRVILDRRAAVLMLAIGVALAVFTWLASDFILDSGALAHLIDAGLGGHPANRPLTGEILTTSFYGTTPATSWWWLTVVSPFTATPFDLVHTMGCALAVIGLMLLAAQYARPVTWPLGAIGSMTLTLYSLHVVLLATLIPSTYDYAYLIHVTIAFAIAVPWRRFIGRGPLEGLCAGAAGRTRELVVTSHPKADGRGSTAPS